MTPAMHGPGKGSGARNRHSANRGLSYDSPCHSTLDMIARWTWCRELSGSPSRSYRRCPMTRSARPRHASGCALTRGVVCARSSLPFEIEVGCGKGSFALEQSRAYPDVNLLAIEWAGEFFAYTADRIRLRGAGECPRAARRRGGVSAPAARRRRSRAWSICISAIPGRRRGIISGAWCRIGFWARRGACSRPAASCGS